MTKANESIGSSPVGELIKDEFAIEVGQGKSSGARRPKFIFLNNMAGFAIGIEIDVKFITGILKQISGDVIYKTNSKFVNIEFRLVYSAIIELIKHSKANCPQSPFGVIGIILRVPGSVNN